MSTSTLTLPIDQNYYLSNGEIVYFYGKMQQIFSPIVINTGRRKKLGAVPLLSADEALQLLKAAKNAYNNGQGKWPSGDPYMRISAVELLARHVEQKKQKIVELLQWEICKTTVDAEKEVDRTIEYIYQTIEAYKTLLEDKKQLRTPRGVVLCMGPYNYPLNELFTTVIPALITGNTVIIKPARIGVLLFEPLLDCLQTIFPAGVVNVLYGDGPTVITPLLKDGGVDSLAFIGGDKTADILLNNHPQPHRLHTVLGLGAKNPGIVLADADINNAVKECVLGSLSFNGQRCTALKILFVHKRIYNQFVNKFCIEVNKLSVGYPWDGNNVVVPHQTPLPEDGKLDIMKAYVDDARSKGAVVANDPVKYNYKNSSMKPVVLSKVPSDARIYHEEQFGPVVPIVQFENYDEVVAWMKDSPYGQQASIFTRQNYLELEVQGYLKPLQNLVSRVNINTQCMRSPDTMPFTGKKSSAKGVLSLTDALLEFTTPFIVYPLEV